MNDWLQRRPRELPPPVAQHQGLTFSTAQAVAAGMSKNQVAYRIKTGVWQRVAGDALRHRDDSVTPQMLAFAAHLTWPDAVLCGPNVAALQGLKVPGLNEVHVIPPFPLPPRLRMVQHQVKLGPDEWWEWHGVKVTSWTRGIMDALVMLPQEEAQALFVWSRTREKVTIADFENHLKNSRGRWGTPRLRRFLADARAGIMSVAEARAHEILHRAGITGWEADVPIRDEQGLIARADILFRRHRLIVHIDGRAYHGPDKFQAERTQANRLAAAGYHQLNFTWDDLTLRRAHVVEQIRVFIDR